MTRLKTDSVRPTSLAELIRTRRGEILANWERAVRQLSVSRDISHPRLLDHLPELLNRIAEAAEKANEGPAPGPMAEAPDRHALERLDLGYELSEVVAEYSLLRSCILELWLENPASVVAVPGEILVFSRAIDDAIAASVTRFSKARQRTLESLDRISAVALETNDMDTFLPALLRVLMETTESVDEVAILLREGDNLRVRACVGIDSELAKSQLVPIGEGFVGKVAAECRPISVRKAATDPLVGSPAIKAKEIRALYGVPLTHESTVIGMAHMGSRTAYDFSEEDKQLFRTMAHRATALIVQHQLRETIDREREDFVNVIAHDLRTPLTTISGAAQLAVARLEKTGERVVVERLRRIGTQVARMTRLLGDLIDARMLASGRLEVRRSPVDLGELLGEVCEEWSSAETEHEISCETEPGVATLADRDRLSQILDNLLSNASKYSPAGSPIRVSARSNGAGEVQVTVEDEGAGIARADLDRIFDPYTRVGSSAGCAKGHGLGLYVTAALVRAQGGRIWAESEPARGTRISFTLPRAK